MAFQWSRCASYLAAAVTAVSLAACGSSSVESQLNPSRVIAFGDGQSDIGQSGSRFTINGLTDVRANWTEEVASVYGRTITPQISGGTSYAWGNTRIVAKPDAAGDATTPTLSDQIGSFLSADTFGGNDLVLVSSGTSDIIVVAQQALNGEITQAEAIAQMRPISAELTGQVKRLRDSGAKYIVVIGAYDMGKSVWARSVEQVSFLEQMSDAFNEGFKISMEEITYQPNVLYVDFEQYINAVEYQPEFYALDNFTSPVCNSIAAGPGIGIGDGKVDSALCTTSTLVSTSYDRYGFADEVYLTPALHRQFGNWAASTIRERW